MNKKEPILRFEEVEFKPHEIKELKEWSRNREVKQEQVLRIRDAIENTGAIIGECVVVYTSLLNDNKEDKNKYWYILDGQHTIRAARELDRLYQEQNILGKLRFVKLPDDSSLKYIYKVTSTINSVKKNWKQIDYFRAYRHLEAYAHCLHLFEDICDKQFTLCRILMIVFPENKNIKSLNGKREYDQGQLTLKGRNPHDIDCLRILMEIRKWLVDENKSKTGLNEFVLNLSAKALRVFKDEKTKTVDLFSTETEFKVTIKGAGGGGTDKTIKYRGTLHNTIIDAYKDMHVEITKSSRADRNYLENTEILDKAFAGIIK
jgi:hypothetical protein